MKRWKQEEKQKSRAGEADGAWHYGWSGSCRKPRRSGSQRMILTSWSLAKDLRLDASLQRSERSYVHKRSCRMSSNCKLRATGWEGVMLVGGGWASCLEWRKQAESYSPVWPRGTPCPRPSRANACTLSWSMDDMLVEAMGPEWSESSNVDRRTHIWPPTLWRPKTPHTTERWEEVVLQVFPQTFNLI